MRSELPTITHSITRKALINRLAKLDNSSQQRLRRLNLLSFTYGSDDPVARVSSYKTKNRQHAFTAESTFNYHHLGPSEANCEQRVFQQPAEIPSRFSSCRLSLESDHAARRGRSRTDWERFLCISCARTSRMSYISCPADDQAA